MIVYRAYMNNSNGLVSSFKAFASLRQRIIMPVNNLFFITNLAPRKKLVDVLSAYLRLWLAQANVLYFN